MDAKRVAASVDVDNMDAALFSSFNARKKSDSTKKKPSLDVSRDSSKSITKTAQQEVMQKWSEQPQQGSREGVVKSVTPLPKSLKWDEQERDGGRCHATPHCVSKSIISPTLPSLPALSPSDLDDILDLLSSEGKATEIKSKEETPARAFSEGEVTKRQGKPITYEEGKGHQQSEQRGRMKVMGV